MNDKQAIPEPIPTIKDVMDAVVRCMDYCARLHVTKIEIEEAGADGFNLLVVVETERGGETWHGRSRTVVPYHAVDTVVMATFAGAINDTLREDG